MTHHPGRTLAASILLAVSLGCYDDSYDPVDNNSLYALTATTTTTQNGAPGVAVATVPAVRATDVRGDPVPSVMVHFNVTAGGGTVGNDSIATNASGVASAGSWTLGPAAGLNTLRASAGSYNATFNATAVAGATAQR